MAGLDATANAVRETCPVGALSLSVWQHSSKAKKLDVIGRRGALRQTVAELSSTGIVHRRRLPRAEGAGGSNEAAASGTTGRHRDEHVDEASPRPTTTPP